VNIRDAHLLEAVRGKSMTGFVWASAGTIWQKISSIRYARTMHGVTLQRQMLARAGGFRLPSPSPTTTQPLVEASRS